MNFGKLLAAALPAVLLTLLAALPAAAEGDLKILVAMISDKPAIVTAPPESSLPSQDGSGSPGDWEEGEAAVPEGPTYPEGAAPDGGENSPPEPSVSDQDATAEVPAPKKIGIVTLSSGNLNVRKGPSLDDEIIGKLPNGSVVDVLEPMEEWVKIPYMGSVAYVSKPYLVIKEVSAVNPAGRKVVVLDPGHGGKDPGAIGKDGTYESNLVFGYALEAKEALEKAGYAVLLTRGASSACADSQNYNYYDELGCRAGFAERAGGDIFISIHADYNPKASFRGTATFYNARNDLDGNQNPYPEESRLLASLVHEAVQPAIGSEDRGIADKNYYVNRMNSVPSILIELACLSNSSDLQILKAEQTRKKFAAALTKAVNQYFSLSD